MAGPSRGGGGGGGGGRGIKLKRVCQPPSRIVSVKDFRSTLAIRYFKSSWYFFEIRLNRLTTDGTNEGMEIMRCAVFTVSNAMNPDFRFFLARIHC